MSVEDTPDLIDESDDHGRDNLRTHDEVIEDILVKEKRKQKTIRLIKRMAVLDWFVLGTVFYILYTTIKDIKKMSGLFLWVSGLAILSMSFSVVYRVWKASEEKPKELPKKTSQKMGAHDKLVRWISVATSFILLIIYLFPKQVSSAFEDVEVNSIGFHLFIYLVCYISVMGQEKQNDKKKGIERPLKWLSWKRALKALGLQLLVYALLFVMTMVLFIVTGGPRLM